MEPRPRRFSTVLCATFLLLGPAALAADAPPAAKQAFRDRPKLYVWFELTQTGHKNFDPAAAKDSLTAGAYVINRSARFAIPFEMAMPGTPPPSSMPLEPNAMNEQGRFVGWAAMPPDLSAAEEQLASGKINLATNPMFTWVEFSVDDRTESRYRDSPTDRFATQTTVTRGKGIAYVGVNGMLLCDLKKMTCDLAGIALAYQGDVDQLTSTSTSDVPGFESQAQKSDPQLWIPAIPADLANKLTAFPLTLPEPSVLAFSGPADTNQQQNTTVSVKMSVSTKPMPKGAAAASK